MSLGKLYGIPLNTGVLQQLRYREKNLSIEEKSVDQLMVDNNQGAWVTLTSSAQTASDNSKARTDYIKWRRDSGTITEEEADKQFASVDEDARKYGNELARANVLSGGTLYGFIDKEGEVNKLKVARKTGIAFGERYSRFGTKSSYENSEVYGFRPMMGITDIKINAIGALGTLRKAVVTIKAHTPEQLSLLETLYFRVGFTMLLEWGNASYLDKDGEPTSLNIGLSTKFNTGNYTLEQIKKLIVEYREKTGYNYDAMVGKVVNFKWSLGENQTYNCSIDILTEGEVIEAVKTSFKPNKEDNVDEYTDKDQADSSKSSDDVLIDHLTALKNFETLSKFKKDKFPEGKLWVYRSYPLNLPATENMEEEDVQAQSHMYFITLRDFCYIFNKLILEKQDTGNINIRFNTEFKKTSFLTFPGHVSNDPAVCTLPFRNGKPYEKAHFRTKEINLYGGIQDKFGTGIYKPKPTRNRKANYQTSEIHRVPNESGLAAKKIFELHSEDETDTINESPLKILINIDHLIAIQEDFIAAETQDDDSGTVSQYFNRLLGDISAGLGGINKLQLLLNEDENEWLIVDSNDSNPGSESTEESEARVPLINVVGLKTTVKDLSIESKISKNIYNNLAAAAVAQGSDATEPGVEALLKFNNNVRDRFTPVVQNTETPQERSQTTKNWVKYNYDGPVSIAAPWHEYVVKGIYNEDSFYSAKELHRKYMQALVAYKNKKAREVKPNKYQGVLPIDLSLTLRGISGLKIGEAFTINNALLPERIRDKVGFSIKGIDHTLGTDNQWITTINTNMYNLPDIEPMIEDELLEDIPRNAPEQNIQPTEDTPNANRLRAKIDELGYIEKGSELSNGGDITTEMADLGISIIETIKKEVPDVTLRFTGGNDKYHQELSYNSRHKSGRALDFVIQPYSVEYYRKVLSIIQGYAAGEDDEVRFKDEYKRLTAAATGQHFHLSFGKGTEGKNELAEAKKLANKGEIQTYRV